MNTLKRYLHRIWFWLGFCPKEAKEIFLEASQELILTYMCPTIIYTEGFRALIGYDFAVSCSDATWYLRAYGFTRKNYIDYVKKNYPELMIYTDGSTDLHWLDRDYIWASSKLHKVYESKQMFLKYLADKL